MAVVPKKKKNPAAVGGGRKRCQVRELQERKKGHESLCNLRSRGGEKGGLLGGKKKERQRGKDHKGGPDSCFD